MLAHVTKRQLNDWADRGIITPLRENGCQGGKGGLSLRWTEPMVARAAALGALSRALGLGGGVDLLRLFAGALVNVEPGAPCGLVIDNGTHEVTLWVRPRVEVGNGHH
jgi:hypothetical protein